jgi:2-succinyl-5-enolpyruvyl-6-hydroxy-3-cyclohexene-1-carboxylate synthase
MISDKKSVQYLLSFLKQKGISDVVLCPGSRNAPFILSFTADSHFQITSYFDEKVAAFIALGMAKNKQKPVVLVCTSGSAVLNFAPAIVEAYYQNIPLWIFTADRPLEWEGKGENQTIHQLEIYKNYITRSVQLEETITLQKAQHLFDDIVCNDFKGPIHFNFPFSEPLYKTVEIDSIQFKIAEKKIKEVEIPEIPPHSKIAIYVSELLPNNPLKQTLEELAKWDHVLIFTEINSNCIAPAFLSRVDHVFSETIPEIYKPDVLITIGGAMISKRARNFFKSNPQIQHIDIAEYPRTWNNISNNFFFILSNHFDTTLKNLIKIEDSCISKEFKSYWNNKEIESKSYLKKYLEHAKYSEYKICNTLVAQAPQNSTIFWGNSSAIRYGGWSMWQERPDLKHISNRGTSGIEGVLATAIGWKKANPKDHIVCILGDISALYEVNSFLAMNEIESMTVIVLNNFGGKIFDNIHPDFSQNAWNAIATPHQQHFEYFAKISNAAYHVFDTLKQENISALLNSTTRQIIEFQFNENTHKDWKEIMGEI